MNGKCSFGKRCAFSHDRSLMKKSDIEQPKTVRLFKSEMCKSFVELGKCKFGDRCQFAHGKEELRDVPRPEKYKTKKCRKFFEEGMCAYGSRCVYLHSEASPQDNKQAAFNFSSSVDIGREERSHFRFLEDKGDRYESLLEYSLDFEFEKDSISSDNSMKSFSSTQTLPSSFLFMSDTTARVFKE
jgi:hypothetical protein